MISWNGCLASMPPVGSADKTFPQDVRECLTRVSRKSVLQERLTQECLSHTQEFPTTVYHRSSKRVIQRVFYEGMSALRLSYQGLRQSYQGFFFFGLLHFFILIFVFLFIATFYFFWSQ